jgi:hypothetical protein
MLMLGETNIVDLDVFKCIESTAKMILKCSPISICMMKQTNKQPTNQPNKHSLHPFHWHPCLPSPRVVDTHPIVRRSLLGEVMPFPAHYFWSRPDSRNCLFALVLLIVISRAFNQIWSITVDVHNLLVDEKNLQHSQGIGKFSKKITFGLDPAGTQQIYLFIIS